MVHWVLPPPKELPGGHGGRAPRHSCQELAERSLSMAPVGVWVERGSGELEQSLAFAAASRVEQELKEQQQQRAARLRRFQGQVQQRVRQQLWERRKQQLQEFCEAAERESTVAMQYPGSTLCLAARRGPCLCQSHPAALICGPGACTTQAQHQEKMQSEPFQQQAAELSRTMKQARLRLASCRAMPPGLRPPRLPGGVWRQESPEPCETPAEGEGKELLLAGHQDPPAELQEQGPALPGAEPEDDFYIKVEFLKLCDGSVRDSSSPEPPQKPHTHCHTPLVLWAGVDQEESKKQCRRQQLRHRSLLMSIERQQVRQQQRQQQRQRRVTQIKSKREKQRWMEEQRLMEMAEQRELSPGEASESLAQLELEERRVEKAEGKEQRHKERLRYLEALRAQLREKIKLCHIDLPPLCSCGSSFWDSHPDSCANNCIFYRNHKAYRRALRSLLSSCEPQGRSSCAQLLLRDLAAACGKRPGGAGRLPSSPPLPQPLV
ncbi:coiled-coil domain-containing protein 15 isoform X2 [Melanerpes formicivorus]|uniref:coiled-coil domain-containing protein 15 isoform X2 n=1 Tax=Melanerpes formicivorus TaxID=211600 RepID=UPI00358F9572